MLERHDQQQFGKEKNCFAYSSISREDNGGTHDRVLEVGKVGTRARGKKNNNKKTKPNKQVEQRP